MICTTLSQAYKFKNEGQTAAQHLCVKMQMRLESHPKALSDGGRTGIVPVACRPFPVIWKIGHFP